MSRIQQSDNHGLNPFGLKFKQPEYQMDYQVKLEQERQYAVNL